MSRRRARSRSSPRRAPSMGCGTSSIRKGPYSPPRWKNRDMVWPLSCLWVWSLTTSRTGMDARRAALPVLPAAALAVVVVPQGAEPDSYRERYKGGAESGTRKMGVQRKDGYGKNLPFATDAADM